MITSTNYEPINAFQRNPDGTMKRDLPPVNHNAYPPNRSYNPAPMIPQRSYDQFAGSKPFTGEVTPIDPNYFVRNNENLNGQPIAGEHPAFSRAHQRPAFELRSSTPTPRPVPTRAELEQELKEILRLHPKFNLAFFEFNHGGIAFPVLVAIGSFFYKEKSFFSMLDILMIGEGKPLIEDIFEHGKFFSSDPLYTHPRYKGVNLVNYHHAPYQTDEQENYILRCMRETVDKVGKLLGVGFLQPHIDKNRKTMTMVNEKSVNITHGKATVSDFSNFNNVREDKIAGGITCKISYFNRCPFDVVVVERSGLRQTVKTRTFNHSPAFIVKRAYTVSKENFEDLTNYFNYVSDESLSLVMKVFKTQFFETLRKEPHAQSMTISVDSAVNASEIKHSGDVYFVSEDLMLSDKSFMTAPDHPFNSRNFNTESFNNFTDESGDIGINFELVDNDGLLSDRFMMLAKKVFKLTPKKDRIRPNGLYLTIMERDPKNPQKKKPIQSHFPLEDLEEKFGIYKTTEEALAGGDIQSLRKETILEMEYNHKVELQKFKNISLDKEKENSELKHQLQQVQLKADNDNQLRKERMAAIEQENKEKDALRDQAEKDRKEMYAERERIRIEEIAKLQLMNKHLEADLDRQRSMTKDYYEGRSYAMKNTNEIVKWIPAMVGALLSVIGIVMIKAKAA